MPTSYWARARVDLKLELVVIPVSDVDRAKRNEPYLTLFVLRSAFNATIVSMFEALPRTCSYHLTSK